MKLKVIYICFLISILWFSNVFALGGNGADGSFDLSLGGNPGGCNGPGMTWYGSYSFQNYRIDYQDSNIEISNYNLASQNQESWSGPACVINTDVKDTFNFTSVNIPSGSYLRGIGSKALRIYATGNVSIGGVISVSGILGYFEWGPPTATSSGAGGYGSGDGPGRGENYVGMYSMIAGGGGFGGAGAAGTNSSVPGGQPYESDDRGGSGGGYYYYTVENRVFHGGGGGGAVFIESNGTLSLNNGKILSNGGCGVRQRFGDRNSGGGSGGQIRLIVKHLSINGTGYLISAGGGAAPGGDYKGAGGGGRVSINFTTREGTDPSSIVNVSRGTPNAQNGVVTINQIQAVSISSLSCPQSIYEGQAGSCVAQAEGSGSIAYEWSFLDGGSFIGDTSGSSVLVRFSQSGNKRVKLKVYLLSDPDSFDERTVTVSVLQNNINLSLDAPLLMALEGSELVNLVSASSSYGGLRYIWNVEGGTFQEVSPPSQGSLRTVRVYPSQVGVMVVRLRGELEEDSSVYSEVSREVEVRQYFLPEFSIRSSGSLSGKVPFTVILSAEADLSGIRKYNPQITYKWDLGDGSPEIVGRRLIAYTYKVPGSYTVRLQVSDNIGNLVEETVGVTVEESEDLMVRSFKVYYSNPYKRVPLRVMVKPVLSYMPGLERVVSQSWSVGSFLVSDRATGVFNFTEPGQYRINFNGVTNYGKNVLGGVDITVNPNQLPVCTMEYEDYPAHGYTRFTPSCSDPDGRVVSYYWEFGNGQVSKSRVGYAYYNQSGSYNVKLTVKDNSGESKTFSWGVSVTR